MSIATSVHRRTALRTAASIGSLPLLGLLPEAFAADPGLRFGPPEPFSFELLIERAKALAARPYVPPPQPAPDVVRQIDYDAHGKLRYRPEYALFGDGPGVYPVTFQFLGGFFPKSVRHARGRRTAWRARSSTRRTISPSPRTARPGELPPDANGFAGFWIQESRLAGRLAQARALGHASWAPPTSAPSASWARSACRRAAWRSTWPAARPRSSRTSSPTGSARPRSESDPVVVHSLLDGPSICGAYRFAIYRDHAAWSWTSRTTCSCARTSSGWASRR